MTIKREVMEADVVVVGAGAAGLSFAYQLQKQWKEQNLADLMIVVLEKGAEVGAHSLSGAVMNPKVIQEMIPNCRDLGFPIETDVKEDAVFYLSQKGAFKLPIVPQPFQNHGNWIVSLSKVNRWLATQCENLGVNIFPGFSAVEVLYEEGKVIGVRTGDKGLDKAGAPKDNFEPGMIIKSKLVLFAEGTRGSLFKAHGKQVELPAPLNPEVFEEGVKEVIQCAPGSVRPGQVIHTMGFPLSKSVGGTFLYTLPDDKVILGLVAYLDTQDPYLDPHRELQRLKTHPWIKKALKEGRVISYGAKTLPAGGWYSRPKMFGDGWMVCGDSAGLVDVQRLKGIHLAMKSGILAAKTAFMALKSNDCTEKTLSQYEVLIQKSNVREELYRVRNFHQTLGKGLWKALPLIALQDLTAGRGLWDQMPIEKDSTTTRSTHEVWGGSELPQDQALPPTDQTLFFDKLGSVYLTGTMHDENSPNHLLLGNGDICRSQCEPKFKAPCTHFCPASVYEMLPIPGRSNGEKFLHINFTNCIHCKTCDIKCPFENIEWTVPEGGGGPRYQDL